MKLRLTPRALADAKRMKTWWLRNRPDAGDLVERELNAGLEQIVTMPHVGSVYEQRDVPVRRLLMPKTRNEPLLASMGSGDELSAHPDARLFAK